MPPREATELDSDSRHSGSRLSPKLDKQLLAYVSAAAATGVTVLAASPAAEAKIVYTPANVSIPTNTAVTFDLNNDGVPDFGFYFYAYGPRKPLGYHQEALSINPLKGGNEVWGIQSSKGDECAAALPPAVKVAAGAAFQSKQVLLWASGGTAYSGPYTFCNWGNLPRGAFLGIKFLIKGQTHFGWAHVTVKHHEAVLNGYAYETVPNQPIRTGKTGGPAELGKLAPGRSPAAPPASLSLLAQGASGLAIWRRPET